LPVLNRGYSPLPQFCEFTMRKPSCIILSHTSTIAY
jgi:hypothetical protein